MTKRVLVIQQYFYPDVSAVSQLLGDLLTELSRMGGYAFTVLCTSVARPAVKGRMPRRLGPVAIRRVPTPNTGKASFLHRLAENAVYYAGALLHLLLIRRYDVVITMTSPPLIGFIVSMAMLFDRRPLLYYVEDLFPELLFDMGVVRTSWLIKKLAVFNRVTLRRAAGVITIGTYVARKLLNNYGYRHPIVVPNWSSCVDYVDPVRAGKFVLTYSGNLGLAHDFGLFETLVKELREVRGIEYRFVGGGSAFEAMRRLFARAGEVRCGFRGYLDRSDLGSMLAGAGVLMVAQSDRTVGDIVPSKYYSYLAAGRPVLFFGTRKSEIGEEVVRCGLGLVIERAEDVQDAKRWIQGLMSDPIQHLGICRAVARHYRAHYGVERAARSVHAILKELAERA